MGKYDPERPGSSKRKKTKKQKFKHHYDEHYSEDDMKELFHRKKKLGKKQKPARWSEEDWPSS